MSNVTVFVNESLTKRVVQDVESQFEISHIGTSPSRLDIDNFDYIRPRAFYPLDEEMIALVDYTNGWYPGFVGRILRSSERGKQKISFQLPEHVISFIRDEHFPSSTPAKIISAKEKIEQFLSGEHIKHHVEVDLFIDPEESKWKEMKLLVKVEANRKTIYNVLEKPIFDSIASTLGADLIKKMLIKIEPF